MKIRTKFNWPTLRRNVKRMVRKKYKKTIKLSEVDSIWNDYVEYAIVQPLLKYGRVEIDQNMSMEIVGRKIENHEKAANLAAKGKYVKGGYISDITKVNYNRLGIVYSIKLTDKSYKGGKLIYNADLKLKKRVSEQLFNTFQYYRISA